MAGNSPQETPYICMAVRLLEAAEPTNARASATPTTPLQLGFAQPHSSPRPAFSTACRLPAGTHGATQPTRRQQPQLARAPARHHSRIERDLSPGQWRTPSTPTTQPSAQGPCRLGQAHRCAKKLLYGRLPPPSRPGKRAIRRRSPPPTPHTCKTATHRSLPPVMLMARWAGVLRTLPHRPQPA